MSTNVGAIGLESVEIERAMNSEGDGESWLHLECEDGTTVNIHLGRYEDELTSAVQLLEAACTGTRANILEGWEDDPDGDSDGFVYESGSGYWVQFAGRAVEPSEYPSSMWERGICYFATRDIATYHLAEAMQGDGYFPNVWYVGERGNYDDIGAATVAFCDEGGCDLKPLDSQYEEGTEVTYEGDLYTVVKDYGPELGYVLYGHYGDVKHDWGNEKLAHVCQWGEWERSNLAGTLHRKCQVAGCKNVTLDGDDDE